MGDIFLFIAALFSSLVLIILIYFFGFFVSSKFSKNPHLAAFPIGVIIFTALLFVISLLTGFSNLSVLINAVIIFAILIWLRSEVKIPRLFFVVFISFFILFILIYLIFFHYGANGNIYGIPIDFSFHNAIVTSIANGGNFPPQYPIFSQEPLRYYYFTDLFIAVFTSLGLDFIVATYLALGIGAASVLSLVFFTAKKIGGQRAAAVAIFLIIFAGSLFFIPYWSEVSSENFKIVPANYFSKGFVFDNAFVETLVLQRNFIFALALFLLLALVIIEKPKNEKYFYLLMGPLISLSFGWHPFVSVTAAVLLFLSGVIFSKLKDKYFWTSIILLIVFALPFLLFFADKASSAVSPSLIFGFLSADKSIFGVTMFWLQNIGLILIPAIIYLVWKGSFSEKIVFASLIPAFLLVNFFKFFVFEWDSMKFIFPLFYILVIFAAAFFVKLIDFKKWFLVLVIPALLLVSFGGAIVAYSFFSQSEIPFFDEYDLRGCAFIDKNIPANATLLTNNEYTCAYGLVGRKVFLGEKFWIETHGFNFTKAEQERDAMLGGDCDLIKKYGITYLYTGGIEGDIFAINQSFLQSNAKLLYQEKHVKLYELHC